MPFVQLLEHELEIGFSGEVDHDRLVADAARMAALINSKSWTADQCEAFRGMNKIVFFAGPVTVNTYVMERPCCDEDDAVFYWEVEEFDRNTDDDVRANTFFHDCWHVVQYRRAGNRYANGEPERLEREIDAVARQVEVARTLGCSPFEIDWLIKFAENPDRVRTRLAEGVDGGPMGHGPDTARG